MLESRGRTAEVGRFLTEDERRSLAARLKQLVGNANEPPALQEKERGVGLRAASCLPDMDAPRALPFAATARRQLQFWEHSRQW